MSLFGSALAAEQPTRLTLFTALSITSNEVYLDNTLNYGIGIEVHGPGEAVIVGAEVETTSGLEQVHPPELQWRCEGTQGGFLSTRAEDLRDVPGIAAAAVHAAARRTARLLLPDPPVRGTHPRHAQHRCRRCDLPRRRRPVPLAVRLHQHHRRAVTRVRILHVRRLRAAAPGGLRGGRLNAASLRSDLRFRVGYAALAAG